MNSKDSIDKIGGSFIGENTYKSIIFKTTKFKNIQESIDEGMKGDHTNLDMTVGDIYGEGMKLLPKNIIASSFGKVKNNLNTQIS